MRLKNNKVGIVGNPNSGKTSIFNLLTGLHQKVGNYPGVTVDSMMGKITHKDGSVTELIDFPGAYSLHSNTHDEFVLTKALIDLKDPHHPDAIIYVADILLLEKQLLLLTQIIDLEFPVIVCLSNCDLAEQSLIDKWTLILEQKLKCPIIPVSSKSHLNLNILKDRLQTIIQFSHIYLSKKNLYSIPTQEIEKLKEDIGFKNKYHHLLWKHYGHKIQSSQIEEYFGKEHSLRLQVEETMDRYGLIDTWVSSVKINLKVKSNAITNKMDHYLTQPILGVSIFIFLMFFIFQAIFSWAQYPMDWIETGFSWFQQFLVNILEPGWFSDLILKGLIPGLRGVLVFVPQIALLFFLIGWMEELGYMARVVYLFDHLLKKVGLNGRSLIGLISGGACAIPAIMSTRNINNHRDRLVTMFVIPLIPCSARIPVYTALIGFVVPYKELFGIFNSQGIAFMALYSLGILMALFTAMIVSYFIKSDELSLLALQLPDYRVPQMRQVITVVFDKVKTFVLQAGKIILLISLILWFMSSFSWSGEMERVEAKVFMEASHKSLDSVETLSLMEAEKLENSFAGKIGKFIEPVVIPLGFDWKIAIALLTSFAAREVFVGTMSTIYSLGSNDSEILLRDRMALEKRPDGSLFFDRKTSISLILFYAFAMQCMSTFAVMWRETKTKRWPIIQFIYMGILAYVASWIAYHWF
ncbi:MAG: ferrous iron transport protein B [Saprospiraceae bacterium]